LQYSFGVTVSLEVVAQSFQLATDLEVVVDFAVKDDDPIAVFGEDWLVAVSDINDF
jgi:hypothetical protein